MLHLLGEDVTTTGNRWSAMAVTDVFFSAARHIGYRVGVLTGPLAGTSETACDVGFLVSGVNVPWGVPVGRVELRDDQRIVPGGLIYSPGTLVEISVLIDVGDGTVHLSVNGVDVPGVFPANLTYLSQISGFAVTSNQAGVPCTFQNPVTFSLP